MGGLPSSSRGLGPGNTLGRGSGGHCQESLLPTGPYERASPHCITDFYRFLPIFTDFSDFLGKTIGNIGSFG